MVGSPIIWDLVLQRFPGQPGHQGFSTGVVGVEVDAVADRGVQDLIAKHGQPSCRGPHGPPTPLGLRKTHEKPCESDSEVLRGHVILLRCRLPHPRHGTAIGLPINWGGAMGVNGAAYDIIYGSPMECLGISSPTQSEVLVLVLTYDIV